MGVAAVARQQYLIASSSQLETQEQLLLQNIQIASTSASRLVMGLQQLGGPQENQTVAQIVQLSQILSKMEMEMNRIQTLKQAIEAEKKTIDKSVQSWADSFKAFA